jgi:hypothetical protein
MLRVTDKPLPLPFHRVYLETFNKGLRNLDPCGCKVREKGAPVLMVCGHMDEAGGNVLLTRP